MKRKILPLLLVAALTAQPILNVNAADIYSEKQKDVQGTEDEQKKSEWIQVGNKWKYQNPDGTYPYNCWKEIEGKWYYFDASGYRVSGWYSMWDNRYYLDPVSGEMQIGWKAIGDNWYYFNGNGEMQTDWQAIEKNWYYFNEKGEMLEGWQAIGNNWYYFHTDGTMQSGWRLIKGRWYYFHTDGTMQSGWRLIKDKWYYFYTDGTMQTGWRLIGNEWYYFKDTGEMVTDWQRIGSKWYFFDQTGVWIEQDPVEGTYLMENTPAVTIEQMIKYFGQSGKEYPAESLEKGGAPDIETFCRIVEEEAQAEGIASEIVFAQAMLETGWLQFKGTVKVEQFNFAGLGATDDGAQGADFSVYGEEGVRMGIRAQVQHLKAYASAEITENTLQNPCVDPRFKYVKKGSVKYLEWLGQKENPEGYGWATSTGYGIKILGMIEKILALDLA